VYYKKVDGKLWKRLKRVKGDGFVERMDEKGRKGIENTSIRYFILEDETRLEMSTFDMMFKFSDKRFWAIKERMDNQTGQVIPLDKR
jgi:hypothetical protein